MAAAAKTAHSADKQSEKSTSEASAASAAPMAELDLGSMAQALALRSRLGNFAMHAFLRGSSRRISQPGDALEQEAHRVAEAVIGVSTPGPSCSSGSSVQAASEAAPPIVREVLAAPGQPLDAATRGFMESRFGHDFSGVRIHTGAKAAQSARALNATAFTLGSDIVFDHGRYAPGTTGGRKLLAHELTHVLQQHGGAHRIQRQEREGSESEAHGVVFSFSVHIDRLLTDDELLVELVKQYRGVDEARARELIASEGWRAADMENPPHVTQEDVDRGYLLIRVRDRGVAASSEGERRGRARYFRGLAQGERGEISAETDRRFWERTRYRPGELLGDSPDDRRMAEYWMILRDDLIRQRQQIDALPEGVRDFVFGDTGLHGTPADCETVLAIARLAMTMTDEERQAYLARTTARTEDPAVFQASLERYLEELAQRRAAALAREDAKTGLVGLDEVYRQYRELVWEQRFHQMDIMNTDSPEEGALVAIAGQLSLTQRWSELEDALEQHGFDSVAAFESSIRAFEHAFRDETLLIANEMLDRLEHVLWQQEERYADPTVGAALYGQLALAREHATDLRTLRVVQGGAGGAIWTEEREREIEQGVATVRSDMEALSEEHPLVTRGDFPQEELALASESDVGAVMLEYIRARRADIRETRRNLADNPDMVWELDSLLQQSMVEQDIQPGSIYAQIIQDHQSDRSWEHGQIMMMIMIFALVLAVLSAGTGTVAVLGAVASLGLSAAQAWDEYRRYEIQSAAAGADLMSEDPSFAWVIVSLVGLGFDLAAVGAALRAARPAVQAFNSTGDIAQLQTDLARLRRLGEIDEAVQRNILRAARAEAEAREAWRLARARYFSRTLAVIDPIVTPLVNLAVHFTYPVYLSVRRGIISLERFLLTHEAVSLIGNFRNLSPAAMARVRSAYRTAFDNAQRVAAHGHSIGMLDSEIEQFLQLWNRHPELPADDVMRQMDQWAEPLASRAGARARTAPEMIMDPETRALLPQFEHQIAGTGGIESIVARRTSEGRVAVTIEGEVLPRRLARRAEDVTPTRRRAPDFNRSRSSLFSAAEAGLDENWQRLHLWGPGFGDEAAAGMMWGPRSLNYVWQNQSVESYIRQLSELAAQRGGRVRVRATAISWENPTPGGFVAPHGENFLKHVEYDVTLIRPGEADTSIRISLGVPEPPSTAAPLFSIDPPNATNLGDLF